MMCVRLMRKGNTIIAEAITSNIAGNRVHFYRITDLEESK